jgi:hypothetical protein
MSLKIIQTGTTALLAIALLALQGGAQRPEPKKTEVRGHTMYTVLKPGDIPAIFEPNFIPVSKAGELYYDDEPLLVVVGGDEVKAYSTWHLDQHEIVNDYINGTAIAATW